MPIAACADKPVYPFGLVADSSCPDRMPPHVPDSDRAEPSASSPPPQSALAASEEEEVLRQIRNLPPELAVLLLSVGTLGFILPGLIGTPALIAGGLALWPRGFSRAETWFAERYPLVHRKSLRQMGRFLADLDRRYPRSSGT